MAFEWRESAEERISFDDSDQMFDDDDSMSLCSWVSENDIVGALTWRGWKRNKISTTTNVELTQHACLNDDNDGNKISSLIELSAKVVAKHYAFQIVEERKSPIPDQIQLRIAFWSFPQSEDDIQLYCCLAHASLEEYQKAETLVKHNKVQDVFQIGFHLSAVVLPTNASKQEKIRYPDKVCLRVPVSESLSRLERNQLQKFAQYLINELPPQVLSTAQGLLDSLLHSPSSAINSLAGAPDPTAGACFVEEPTWYLDEVSLRDSIRKILCKFCGPSPVAFVDLNSLFLTSSAPVPSLEWSNILRPLTSRDPEGIWNLFDIIRDLLKRRDANALKILQILTEECLNFHQLTLWWFIDETGDGDEAVSTGNNRRNHNHNNQNYSNSNLANTEFAMHTGARIQKEIINLWKIALMNPYLSESERKTLRVDLENWHKVAIEKAKGGFTGGERKFNLFLSKFEGFMPAVSASQKNWKLFYEKLGITEQSNSASSNRLTLTDEADFESLYSCIEALYYFGFTSAVQDLAIHLAQRLLSRYNIKDNYDHIQLPASSNVIGKDQDISRKFPDNSDRVSEALKVAFICKLLKESSENQHLAFKIAILGLGLTRYPVDSKSLEVKLTHCEMTLRSALKLVVVTNKELGIIRKYARFLLNIDLVDMNMVTPYILAIYVFEVLCDAPVQSNLLTKQRVKFANDCQPSKEDNDLGYRAAMNILGKRSWISESQHPMACESLRRLHADLALSMICHYKDDRDKITAILSLILDINKYESSMDKSEWKNINQLMATNDEKDPNIRKSSLVEVKDKINKQKEAEIEHHAGFCGPPSSEDWDAEVDQMPNTDISHDANRQVTGTVTGILQFDVNVVNEEAGFCHESTYPVSQVSDATSYTNEQLKESLVNNDVNQVSLEKCNPNNGPERYGLVVVSGLSPTEQQSPKRLSSSSSSSSSDSQSCSQSFDSTNQWDPALSWADASEEKATLSNAAHSIASSQVPSQEQRDRSITNKDRQEKGNHKFDNVRVESDSYALFELAKNVLLKASENQTERHNQNIHRGLRLAAFEIGLHSLNLQNLVSPKWMSRTYSFHVSWIAGQCMDVGSSALRILNEKWQGILTPSEVIDIANRASRCGEALLCRTAAELAVSCLPQSHTLNPGEMQQALALCKDIDTAMLTRACNAIEHASKSGGIQPEILFLVARQWHYIHEKTEEESSSDVHASNNKSRMSSEQRASHQSSGNRFQMPSASKQPLATTNTDISSITNNPAVTLLTAEQYVQQQMHQMAQEILSRNLSRQQQQQQKQLPDEIASFSWIYPQYLGSLRHCPMPQHVLRGKSMANSDTISMPVVNYISEEELDSIPQELRNAYRVGMKALESLVNRSSEERASVKYSQTPPCSDDIRWLCALAASLGPTHLGKFCTSVIGAVTSPYVLHDIALEAARHFALYNPAQLASHLRSPCVSPIVTKCLSMYTELLRHNLALLSQNGYDDFVELLRRARSAFCMAPGGMTKFNEILEMVRKRYPMKKDLWQLIMNGLSRA
eukprot:gene16687-18381_t